VIYVNCTVLVDGPNLYGSESDAGYKTALDKVGLILQLLGEDPNSISFSRKYFTNRTTLDDDSWKRFCHFVTQRADFEMIVGEKADIDADLIQAILSAAQDKTVDIILLVSGDSDYQQAVQAALTNGKRVVILASEETLSHVYSKLNTDIFKLQDPAVKEILYREDYNHLEMALEHIEDFLESIAIILTPRRNGQLSVTIRRGEREVSGTI